MSELADYRVETDTTVLLVYQDGTELRVPTKRLSRYLQGEELQRVKDALKLRKQFWKEHLPKEGLAVGLAVALIGVGWAGSNQMAQRQVAPAKQAALESAVTSAQPVATPASAATPTPPTTGEVAGAETVNTSAMPNSPQATPKATSKPIDTLKATAIRVSPTPTPKPKIVVHTNPVTKVVDDITKAVTDPIKRLLP